MIHKSVLFSKQQQKHASENNHGTGQSEKVTNIVRPAYEGDNIFTLVHVCLFVMLWTIGQILMKQ